MSIATQNNSSVTRKRGPWVSEATSTPPTRLLLPPLRGRHHAHKLTPDAHRVSHLIAKATTR